MDSVCGHRATRFFPSDRGVSIHAIQIYQVISTSNRVHPHVIHAKRAIQTVNIYTPYIQSVAKIRISIHQKFQIFQPLPFNIASPENIYQQINIAYI